MHRLHLNAQIRTHYKNVKHNKTVNIEKQSLKQKKTLNIRKNNITGDTSTVGQRKFRNCFVHSRNAVRTTENSVDLSQIVGILARTA